MDTTLSKVIERVRRDSSLASRGPVFSLASQHTAGATTVLINETPEFGGPGSVLAMGTSLYYVQSVDPVAKSFTVIPGYFGSTDETHNPPMVVTVDDRLPGAMLKDHAEKEIGSWREKLWRVRTATITGSPSSLAYNFDTGTDEVIRLLGIRRAPAQLGWFGFMWDDDRWPHVRGRLVRNANTATFPAGKAIQLQTRVPEGEVRVWYAARFVTSTFTLTTNLVTDVGLEESWVDVLELGMRARAMSGQIVSRADWRAGGHARMAEETSLLDVVRAAQQARSDRDRELADAANELRGRFPFRST